MQLMLVVMRVTVYNLRISVFLVRYAKMQDFVFVCVDCCCCSVPNIGCIHVFMRNYICASMFTCDLIGFGLMSLLPFINLVCALWFAC